MPLQSAQLDVINAKSVCLATTIKPERVFLTMYQIVKFLDT